MKKLTLITAALLILIGIVSLLNIYFELHLWRFVFPALLILLGVWLISSPDAREKFSFSHIVLLGDAEIKQPDETLLLGVGDVKLDLTKGLFLPGENQIGVTAFVAEIKVLFPPDKGLWIKSNSLITSAKVDGDEEDNIFYPYEFVSEHYGEAETKVKLLVRSVVSEIKVIHS